MKWTHFHVILTSDDDWDPSILDFDPDVEDLDDLPTAGL